MTIAFWAIPIFFLRLFIRKVGCCLCQTIGSKSEIKNTAKSNAMDKYWYIKLQKQLLEVGDVESYFQSL